MPQHASLWVADDTYETPSKEWVLDTFPAWYKDYMFKAGLDKWVETNDCDDKSSLFKGFAQSAHMAYFYRALTQSAHSLSVDYLNLSSQSIAIGELWFKVDDGCTHAVNCAVIKVEQDFQLLIIEPQTCEELKLSVSELASVYYVRF